MSSTTTIQEQTEQMAVDTWSAGVLFHDGSTTFLRTGQTSRAGTRTWRKRDTAAKNAVEYFGRLQAKFDGYRQGGRDQGTRLPIAAVVCTQDGYVQLAGVENPDHSSRSMNLWWGVQVRESFGRAIRSIHRDRKEAREIADRCADTTVCLVSFPGLISYDAARLPVGGAV